MGMYTHLRLDVEIYPTFEAEILNYIESVPRLRCTSYYFMDQGKHFIEIDDNARTIFSPDDRKVIAGMRILHADVSLKNYTGEIEDYLDFLKGKILNAGREGDYVGTIRYEEDSVPDLLFVEDGGIVRKKIKEME
jgi:hypothetical protein